MLSKNETKLRQELQEKLYDTNIFSPEYVEILDQIYLLNYKDNNDEEFTNYHQCMEETKMKARASIDPDWYEFMAECGKKNYYETLYYKKFVK